MNQGFKSSEKIMIPGDARPAYRDLSVLDIKDTPIAVQEIINNTVDVVNGLLRDNEKQYESANRKLHESVLRLLAISPFISSDDAIKEIKARESFKQIREEALHALGYWKEDKSSDNTVEAE